MKTKKDWACILEGFLHELPSCGSNGSQTGLGESSHHEWHDLFDLYLIQPPRNKSRIDLTTYTLHTEAKTLLSKSDVTLGASCIYQQLCKSKLMMMEQRRRKKPPFSTFREKYMKCEIVPQKSKNVLKSRCYPDAKRRVASHRLASEATFRPFEEINDFRKKHHEFFLKRAEERKISTYSKKHGNETRGQKTVWIIFYDKGFIPILFHFSSAQKSKWCMSSVAPAWPSCRCRRCPCDNQGLVNIFQISIRIPEEAFFEVSRPDAWCPL